MSRKIFEYDQTERTGKNLFTDGFEYVLGCDEAGRGPAAGPLFTACVCFKNKDRLFETMPKLNDSKKITEKTRAELYPIIKENSVFSIVKIEIEKIEEINILNASLLGMKQAALEVISKLKSENILVLVDGNKPLPDFSFFQKPVVKGDSLSASIAAASILAKVARDSLMLEMDKKYPEYNFAGNKGYLTKEHIESIKKHGITEIHRKSYLKNILSNEHSNAAHDNTDKNLTLVFKP